jgi:60 kDa SS-A/Ro ribonucleoprotein
MTGKFNKKPTVKREIEKAKPTKNLAGGLSFDPSIKLKLTLQAITALMGQDKYYQSSQESDSQLDKSIDAVLAQDPEYALKLARFCRTEMHLRSFPIYLLAKYATSGVNLPNTRHYVEETVQRADEIMELLAASFALTNTTGAVKNKDLNFIKYGLNGAFNKFDEYQFSKYDKAREVKLIDALRLAHPKPKDEAQSKLFEKIKNGELEPAMTWERYISMNGSTKENWETILPNMGHMALLKNLRNFLLTGANIDVVVNQFTNPEAVLHGKQFPYSYLTAFRAIEQIPLNKKPTYDRNAYTRNVGAVKDALQTALDISVANVPKLRGNSFVLVDHSGSMTNHEINQRPNGRDSDERIRIYASDIAGLFGAMSVHICENSTVYAFAEKFKQIFVSKRDGILTTAEQIVSAKVCEGTYGHLPIIDIMEKGLVFDRIIMLSDEQLYKTPYSARYDSVAEAFMEYQRKINPNAFLHSVDLCGYATLALPENARNVSAIGGWSDKIFDFMNTFEKAGTSLVEQIENYQMPKKKHSVLKKRD